MKKLIIIGARGFGREYYNNLLIDEQYGKTFVIKGFLDSKADALDSFDGYAPILNSPEEYTPEPGDVFTCALGDSLYRRKYVDIMREKGAEFISIISPSAIIHPTARLGTGVRIGPFCQVSADTKLGDFCVLQSYCLLGHDASAGNWSTLRSYSFMGGFSQLDEGVTLQPHATVLPHKKVGAWATVGAGSVVVRHVKAGSTVYGNPAVRLKW